MTQKIAVPFVPDGIEVLGVLESEIKVGDLIVGYLSRSQWAAETRYGLLVTEVSDESFGVFDWPRWHDFAPNHPCRFAVIRDCVMVSEVALLAGDLILEQKELTDPDPKWQAKFVWSLTRDFIDEWTVSSTSCGQIVDSKGRMIHEITNARDFLFIVKRREASTGDRIKLDHGKVSKSDSGWNGTCLRCGRGTYQGLFELKHEGGSCF